MNLLSRVVAFLVICGALYGISWYWTSVKSPTTATEVALDSVNGKDGDAENQRAYETGFKNMVPDFCFGFGFGSFLILFGPVLYRWAKSCPCCNETTKKAGLIAFLFIFPFLNGCWRDYDVPEFEEIQNNETGFLLPLEGDSDKQVKFASEQFLEERKVAQKRVPIPHRWVQTGRLDSTGKYIPTVKLIKVNRSPVVREWTAEQTTGTATKDQSIKVESRDSVGFEIGFNVTAMITEKDASKFLYWYASGNLAQVMDDEVRGRIQKATADECAKFDLDILRTKKNEICEAIRKDVVPYYADRGITITNIGMVGGLHYENAEIQKAIDETVKKQQLKVNALAEFEAQAKVNERVLLEAEAQAERARRIAKGEADAKLLVATAEAEGIKAVNKALSEAQQSGGILIQVKQLDIERARIDKWNGQYPTYMMNMGSSNAAPNLLLNVPAAK